MGHLALYQSHFVIRRDVYGYYPAILIFTPIFPSHCNIWEIDPVHFGIIMVFNFNHRTVYAP